MCVPGLFEDAWIDLGNSFFVSKGHNPTIMVTYNNDIHAQVRVSLRDGLDIVIYLLN